MKTSQQFGPVPDPNYIDTETGYSLSIPAVLQGPPFWWEDNPQAYERIITLRNAMGITVDDWQGGTRPTRPRGFGPSRLRTGRKRPSWLPSTQNDANGPEKGAQR